MQITAALLLLHITLILALHLLFPIFTFRCTQYGINLWATFWWVKPICPLLQTYSLERGHLLRSVELWALLNAATQWLFGFFIISGIVLTLVHWLIYSLKFPFRARWKGECLFFLEKLGVLLRLVFFLQSPLFELQQVLPRLIWNFLLI